MKKKIAIMLTLILAAGAFTACAAEEKVNNDIQTSVVSRAADVSVSEDTSATTNSSTAEKETTETTTTEKPLFQKKQSLWNRIPKPKKKPTVGKIRRLFRQLIRFRKHKQRFRITARIQRIVISKNRNLLLKKKLKLLLKSLCRSLQKSQRKSLRKNQRRNQRRNQRTILRNRLQRQKRLMFSMW